MEITIKTRCPHCDREIIIDGKDKKEPGRNSPDHISFLFGKMISRQEDDKKISDGLQLSQFLRSVEAGGKINAKDYLDDYFFMLKNQIRATKNKKDLIKIRNKLKNTHVKISNSLREDLKHKKKMLLEDIERKIHEKKK